MIRPNFPSPSGRGVPEFYEGGVREHLRTLGAKFQINITGEFRRLDNTN